MRVQNKIDWVKYVGLFKVILNKLFNNLFNGERDLWFNSYDFMK